jgi:hypothetical protein
MVHGFADIQKLQEPPKIPKQDIGGQRMNVLGGRPYLNGTILAALTAAV